MDAFWQMQREMSLHPTSTHYRDNERQDLTKFPGWQSADDSTRIRILSAARQYIVECDARPGEWLGKPLIHFAAIAGYRVLKLLRALEPAWIEALPMSVWRRWAPAIIGYPTASSDDLAREEHRLLVALSYRHAPDETLWALAVLIERENGAHGHLFISRELVRCWDDRLGSLLLLKAQDPSLKPRFFGSLLDELLDHRVTGAREYAASLLLLPLPVDPGERARVQAAAQALFAHTEDAGGVLVMDVFRSDPQFGRQVILGAAPRIGRQQEARWDHLSVEEVTALFLWMENQFAHAEDRDCFTGEAHIITPRDSVADVRDGLLKNLSDRGTRASLEAIRRIEQAHPGADWITFIRIHAEERMLQGTRTLLSPEQVIALQPRAAGRVMGQTNAPGNHEPRLTEEHMGTAQLIDRCEVLLITVTDIETTAVLEEAKRVTGRESSRTFGKIKTYLDLAEIGGARVFLVRSEMGSDTPGGSTLTTIRAISEVRPTSVIMVGIAFGVNPEKQPIGQVLVSQQLQCYGSQRIGTDKDNSALLTPRGDKVTASVMLLDRLKAAKLCWGGGGLDDVEHCLLLSGPNLVDNIDYREQLVKLFPEAKGGEMEGAGLYAAAMEEKVDWIIVKAVCDWADGNKHEDKAARQEKAARRAASFVFHALSQGGLAPRKT